MHGLGAGKLAGPVSLLASADAVQVSGVASNVSQRHPLLETHHIWILNLLMFQPFQCHEPNWIQLLADAVAS